MFFIWFTDKIINPFRENHLALPFKSTGGKRNDFGSQTIERCSNLLSSLAPIHLWHPYIHKNKIGLPFLPDFHGFFAVYRLANFKTCSIICRQKRFQNFDQ